MIGSIERLAMPKRGPKVRELAEDLGVTSRELIDRCRAEGLKLQNSITRIKPEQVPRIRNWFSAESTTPDET